MGCSDTRKVYGSLAVRGVFQHWSMRRPCPLPAGSYFLHALRLSSAPVYNRSAGYELDKTLARLCFSTTYVCVDRPISRVSFGSLFPICSRFVPSLWGDMSTHSQRGISGLSCFAFKHEPQFRSWSTSVLPSVRYHLPEVRKV